MIRLLLAICCILIAPAFLWAQGKDSLVVKDTSGTVVAPKPVDTAKTQADTSSQKVYSPRKAALYSAIMPGLGQIYNKKYWKVPIAWAAVGIPIYTFFYNRGWYNRLRYALQVGEMDPNDPSYGESLEKVDSKLQRYVVEGRSSSLLNWRNEYRKNMDYSILFTLLFWGLNVVDGTVDAHLKGFNVNDNLTMQIKPALLSRSAVGVSLVFKFDKNGPKN